MTRSGYTDDHGDSWALVRWRGAVKRAINGKRGQAFLKEMLVALDSLPEKILVADELVTETGEVCAIGSVMVKRGVDTSNIDICDSDSIASALGISDALVREIEHINDRYIYFWDGSNNADGSRFERVREWILDHIKEEVKV